MFEVRVPAVKVRQTMLDEIEIQINGQKRVRVLPKEKFKKYFKRNSKINHHYLINCNWFLFEVTNEDYNIIEDNYYSFADDEYFLFYFDTEEEAFYFKMKYG